MATVLKNVYIDKLPGMVKQYNKTIYKIIKIESYI